MKTSCDCDVDDYTLKYIEHVSEHRVPDFNAFSPALFHGSPQEIVDRLNNPANKPKEEVTHYMVEREAVFVCEGCDKHLPWREDDIGLLISLLGEYLAEDPNVEEWKGESE